MKKLQILSLIVLTITIIGIVLWRFVISLPDWSVRVIGVAMLISIFTTVFSTVKMVQTK